MELVATKVSYIVQEATVVIRNIFRKYPNQYESIISTLCENLDSLDEPEAKAAMIWVIGQYADRIDNSDVLLDDFLYTFADEPTEVQLALLTATVKLFIQRPTKGQQLVPKVLKWATEETDNPDLRDRGYMYWRLLSSDPNIAKQIVMGEKPAITAEESEKLDPATLEEMCLNVGTLATVYLKPVHQVFRSARSRRLQDSPALQTQTLPTTIAAKKAAAERPGLDTSFASPNNGSNGNLSAAIDAADTYFAAVSPTAAAAPQNMSIQAQMARMQLSPDASSAVGYANYGGIPSPTVGMAPGQGYVVTQNAHVQSMQQQGDNNGDLLLL